MRRALVIASLLAAFAAAAALGGSVATSDSTLPPESVPVSSGVSAAEEEPPGPTQPPALSLWLADSSVAYGRTVAVNGALTPVGAEREIVVEIHADGGWVGVRQTTTRADGTWSAAVDLTGSGLVRARTAESDVVGDPVAVVVKPKVRLKQPRGLAYGGARVAARVEPDSYTGTAELIVTRRGKEVATVSGEVADGRLRARVPLPGAGRFRIVVEFPGRNELAPATVSRRVAAKGRTLSVGSSGPDVRGLRERLAELHVRVPTASADFGYELRDSVVAFQKAYGLERTGTVDTATWRALERAKLIKPRYREAGLHIEVDKTRQILMVVRDGEVSTVLPVSSGATGNTPEGKHQIRWKALATTTWLGPGILYRTMTFYENSVAIHGWSSVPEYPASHGCVRIPMWIADWLYNQSSVGETVYVYH